MISINNCERLNTSSMAYFDLSSNSSSWSAALPSKSISGMMLRCCIRVMLMSNSFPMQYVRLGVSDSSEVCGGLVFSGERLEGS